MSYQVPLCLFTCYLIISLTCFDPEENTWFPLRLMVSLWKEKKVGMF